LACHSCNIFKAARQQATDPETSIIVPLFHPRRDRWDDHFEPSNDSLMLSGKTSVGRATIAVLQLNSNEQQFSRRFWKRLDLFP